MPIASIARRLLGGGSRRATPGRRPAPGPGGPAGGAGGTDAQVGRAAKKGLRRLLR